MKRITPFLWYDGKAEEAMNLYISAFKNSKKVNVNPMSATFQLEGLDVIALNAGPMFKFTPATSFFVNCDTEEEIDHAWKVLSEGGMVMMPLNKYPFSEKFGWTQDKYGLSWQLHLAPGKQKVTPFLMYVGDQNGRAEEAAKFYTSVFNNSAIEKMVHYGPGEQGTEGTVKHGAFTLDGQQIMVMDGGTAHKFTFTEAYSLYVNCETQEEVDYYWSKLLEGGEPSRCGWLKDKFGVSWQVIPSVLPGLIGGPDREKSQRAMNAMLQMQKIEIKGLQDAYDGK